MTDTGMNAAMLVTLYDTSITTSFGYYLAQVEAEQQTKYACTEETGKCSNEELAFLQWGGSEITLNPLYSDSTYTPISTTVADWGPAVGGSVAECPGITIAPEYYYYTSDPYSHGSGVAPKFSIVQVQKIVSP